MLIDRGDLLARLHEASVGLSPKEVIQQSNCFVFTQDQLITFNDSIMVRADSPLDFDVIVQASELLTILSKMPDEQLVVKKREGELLIKGGDTKTAAIACQMEMALQVVNLPMPEKWHRLTEGTLMGLQQAARTCGRDENIYLSMCIHAAPDRIEGCDNSRLFRLSGQTGFPDDVLLPADSVKALEGLEIRRVALVDGWAHFRLSSGTVVSVRCFMDEYHQGLDAMLNLTDPERVTLPVGLGEIIGRASVFMSGEVDSTVGVKLSTGLLEVTSRKDTGWYRERHEIDYGGRDLAFNVNPKFLVEVMKKTRDVLVDGNKMKIEAGNLEFVVGLVLQNTGVAGGTV